MKYTRKRARQIVFKITDYMREKGIPYAFADRDGQDGATAMRRHIKGLLYAQLSNQTRWAVIAPKLRQVDELFFQYDRDQLLAHPAEYYVAGIRALKCGNRSIQKQMEALHANIHTLERIEADHGSLDAFVTTHPPEELVRMLSDASGAYKLRHIGYALAWEYLRAAGVDAAKPDVHLRRMLGDARLGFSSRHVAAEGEINPILAKMAVDAGMRVSALDDMLWAFCADGYGSVCTAKPDCRACPVRHHCNRDRRAHGDTGRKTNGHD